jgi:tetratricopeptide (TPR) repeat protein/transcriptional regulator with XRE-family HTH domain
MIPLMTSEGYAYLTVRWGVVVAEPPLMSFGRLLKNLRTSAKMTQEELAEQAGLSPRSISDLERGIHVTARRETAQLLADALGLTGSARTAFEAAARGEAIPVTRGDPIPVMGVAAATRTLPRDIGSFTGRESELRQLVNTVGDHISSGLVTGIYAIGGMAGIGKTAFAVHAAHQLAPQFPGGQIFLPLHGHTPGQQPVDPNDALASLLQTAGMAAQQIPSGLEPRTRLWRDYLVGKQLLLLLDDAAGHEQVRPLLPGTAGSLVLVTSRRHLTALEDAQAISLDTLTPDAAADLLVRVTSRPDLSATDPAVQEITRLCGYLPLAVGILGRQLHHHPTWAAVGLSADLAAARDRLQLMRAENLSVAAALDLSYQDLDEDQKRMFRRLGLHPGTEIDAYAAAALDNIDLAAARLRLDALYDQYLLAEPTHGRYRFHDLVGEHARDLGTHDAPTNSEAALDRLIDYYLRVALAADRHLARRTPAGKPAPAGIAPVDVPNLPDRNSAVSWMEAERFNLHAIAGYAATHERAHQAIAIAAAMHGFLRSQGHWQQALTLHRLAFDVARQIDDRLAQAGALADLGDMQTLSGAYHAATGSHEQALELYSGLGDMLGEANALNKLATVQQAVGHFRIATTNLTRALELHRALGDRLGEANDLNQLGVVQYETGAYQLAAASHEQALELRRMLGDELGEANALYRLGSVQQATGNNQAATASLHQALALHRKVGYRFGEATAFSQLGSVQQAAGDFQAATATQEQALELYRILGYPRGEADALNNLGVARQAIGDEQAAAANYVRALELYRNIGFRLGEAEALNNLGELSLASATAADALSHFERALSIAKGVASLLQEARALEGLGRFQLRCGRDTEATALLRQSLTIYQRIGSPSARRVETALRQSDL